MPELTPLFLQDAPSLIELAFPSQKVSYEAQRERKAGAGQTLTSLGSYWKGRKPLILVRAIVLGSLLPQTGNAERDLEIFEKLMAFDSDGLARRALMQKALRPKDLASLIELRNPWDYFAFNSKKSLLSDAEVSDLCFPIDLTGKGVTIRWRRDMDESEQLSIFSRALETFPTYEDKAALCKRPEEVDQSWLYEPIWPDVNRHYAQFGIEVHSHQELIEQLGILRYGRNPMVGDTFAGGGSIPFEAARLGCDIYASDLNPIACMLTWGALNVIGANAERRAEIEKAQEEAYEAVEQEVGSLGIEQDKDGNRAKAFLYCLEARCPESGWLVPLSWTWVISRTWNVIAKLVPDHENQRFEIEIHSGVKDAELVAADIGTVRDGRLVYELDGKQYSTPIKTLRGEFQDSNGETVSKLRRWKRLDFIPHSDDIYSERLYCVQWIRKASLDQHRKDAFFAAVTADDIAREREVESIVSRNIEAWQQDGLVPDMEIEIGGPPRYQGRDLVVARGWSHWHHVFNARQLLQFALIKRYAKSKEGALSLGLCSAVSWNSRLCSWDSSDKGREGPKNVFTNQALNTIYNYGCRSFYSLRKFAFPDYPRSIPLSVEMELSSNPADQISTVCTHWITDPPYADAVMYHEITELFIAWLRKNPPSPFDQWTWDSRRALAIKGSGDDFRRGMVNAYSAMTEHMPDNGMQCVMFTHQDTGVWSDMVGIFWASGLQVVGAWYIATETTSELKKGGYVQGTVILMLRKRRAVENSGFKQRILPAVRNEVKRQIEQMMNLNDEVKQKLGDPVFNDSDLQMAGYAAALKVLTAYTQIGGEDVTSFALRPRQRGEVTVVDEIVQQAAEAANSLLVPEGLTGDTWQRITGVQRFYLRMVDMETTGASKLDNYQNFAKAFRVDDYTSIMRNMTANKARLKRVSEFKSRDLTAGTEIGATWLGRLVIGLQQLIADTDPQVVVSQLQMELPDFMEVRPMLVDMLRFLQAKAPEAPVRDVAEVLANRLRNLRALGQ